MNAGISKLRRVLLAYSLHNPAVEYCQGFNRIAAIALLFLDEEDAFWCLLYIVELLMPGSYYTKHMSGAMVDQVNITPGNINCFINIKYSRRFSRKCSVKSFPSLQYILVSYISYFCLYFYPQCCIQNPMGWTCPCSPSTGSSAYLLALPQSILIYIFGILFCLRDLR